jgi:surfactin synthase thioesterase subunit
VQILQIPGGHMYLTQSPQILLRMIETLVTAAVGPAWSPV